MSFVLLISSRVLRLSTICPYSRNLVADRFAPKLGRLFDSDRVDIKKLFEFVATLNFANVLAVADDAP
jgi:hypothetical protein